MKNNWENIIGFGSILLFHVALFMMLWNLNSTYQTRPIHPQQTQKSKDFNIGDPTTWTDPKHLANPANPLSPLD